MKNLRLTYQLIAIPAAFSLSADVYKRQAEQMDQYLPLLKGKRIGMVVNHTSVVPT